MRNLFFVLLTITVSAVRGADSLHIVLSKTILAKGDSLEFTCAMPYYQSTGLASATLNVWIEDIQKTRRWKFRYPMINGEVAAALGVNASIPDGKYAINFIVQRGLFRLSGTVEDHVKSETVINYMMYPKNKETYVDNTPVSDNGNFRLKSTLFEDSAYFIFSPVKKSRNNPLNIRIQTLLDSAFTPVFTRTLFVTVSNGQPSSNTDTSSYAFNIKEISDPTLLPNVTVFGKAKKKADEYEAQYVSGLFKDNNAITFDGMENDDILHALSIFRFLQARVPGLTITANAQGEEIASWRGQAVDIYIDEFRVQPTDQSLVSPGDVAMIKVYRPPAFLTSGNSSNGAIAIYTKRGGFNDNDKNRHTFIVKGYTALDAAWK